MFPNVCLMQGISFEIWWLMYFHQKNLPMYLYLTMIQKIFLSKWLIIADFKASYYVIKGPSNNKKNSQYIFF